MKKINVCFNILRGALALGAIAVNNCFENMKILFVICMMSMGVLAIMQSQYNKRKRENNN